MAGHVIEDDVENHYELLDDRGTGQYATVMAAKNNTTGQIVAIKFIDRRVTGLNMIDPVIAKEIEVMLRIDHPACVRLFEIYQTATQVQMVMELLEGRDLFDRILSLKRYTEPEAKTLMRRVCQGVKFLHEQKVIHRDLKNILLCSDENDTECKVADFGLSKLFPEDIQGPLTTETLCGTPGYVAPEVLNRAPYGVKVDVWSLGVITYITLCGFPPFPLDMATNSVRKVKAAEFTFPMPQWADISEAAKEFIRGMIVANPDERMTMDQVLAHPWLAEGAAEGANAEQ